MKKVVLFAFSLFALSSLTDRIGISDGRSEPGPAGFVAKMAASPDEAGGSSVRT